MNDDILLVALIVTCFAYSSAYTMTELPRLLVDEGWHHCSSLGHRIYCLQ